MLVAAALFMIVVVHVVTGPIVFLRDGGAVMVGRVLKVFTNWQGWLGPLADAPIIAYNLPGICLLGYQGYLSPYQR